MACGFWRYRYAELRTVQVIAREGTLDTDRTIYRDMPSRRSARCRCGRCAPLLLIGVLAAIKQKTVSGVRTAKIVISGR